MCKILTACSIVRYITAGVRVVKIFTVLTACSTVQYITAAVKIVKICVKFLLLVVLYVTLLQQ